MMNTENNKVCMQYLFEDNILEENEDEWYAIIEKAEPILTPIFLQSRFFCAEDFDEIYSVEDALHKNLVGEWASCASYEAKMELYTLAKEIFKW